MRKIDLRRRIWTSFIKSPPTCMSPSSRSSSLMRNRSPQGTTTVAVDLPPPFPPPPPPEDAPPPVATAGEEEEALVLAMFPEDEAGERTHAPPVEEEDEARPRAAPPSAPPSVPAPALYVRLTARVAAVDILWNTERMPGPCDLGAM